MQNHLKTETSPYLLQHENNPVDWYPWHEDAFKKASSEDKPIFLSIGYSTCHWCHVMAKESFENENIAEILNRGFVSIKVDREERPDIDAIYMNACHIMNGSGGWPLTILMTPDKKPFFSGTYLPPYSKYGRTGLSELLLRTEQLWNTNRSDLLKLSDAITSYVNSPRRTSDSVPSKELIHAAYSELSESFDSKWGGFGNAPKFPMPHNINFLIDYSIVKNDNEIFHMADLTLTRMVQGGIFDHIGGGFCRYSTDSIWLAPHFEKMLYDNALLISTYIKAWKHSGKPLFKFAAEKTADYVIRELTSPDGAFYCAQDADSDGQEGKYYIFTPEEIINILGSTEAAKFCSIFDITEKGNFESKNIPNLINTAGIMYSSSSELTDINNLKENSYQTHYSEFNDSGNPLNLQNNINPYELLHENTISRLYEYRKNRTKLHRDEKVLTSWNGMMIKALSEAATILDRPDFLTAAKKAEKFIRKNMINDNNRLLTAFSGDRASVTAYLDDYAFYSDSLISLYAATGNIDYLISAENLAEQIIEFFADKENGGFYLTADYAEELIGRPKETADGALPSGNSIAACVFGKLAVMTGKEIWQSRLDKQLKFLSSVAKRYPSAHCAALSAMFLSLYPSYELLCVTSEKNTEKIFKNISCLNLPLNTTILIKTPYNSQKLGQIAPFTENYSIPKTGTQYYLCSENTCIEPFNNLTDLTKYLAHKH